jgi:hypothetical protein
MQISITQFPENANESSLFPSTLRRVDSTGNRVDKSRDFYYNSPCTMAEVAGNISTHRSGNCRKRKGFSAEGHACCHAGISWGRAEYARNCHHIRDEAQTWGRPTISPCPQDMGFLFSYEEEKRLRL